MVQQLFPILPAGFVAAPRVHLGPAFEIDAAAVATFAHPSLDPDTMPSQHGGPPGQNNAEQKSEPRADRQGKHQEAEGNVLKGTE
jgi:hypothetical protein